MSKIKNRQKVSELIISVLTEQTTVRQALLSFPRDTFDKSIECAWHALIHYEADEDIRGKDAEFREEQDNFLYFLSNLLKEGKDLPVNILQDYKKFHGGTPIPANEKNFWAKLLKFFRFINVN
ncbi:MAG: hypothetical protein WCF95_02440 [bacterium]|jgi:hypothetical protein